MQREMQTAIAKELYERAAELRDAIKLLQAKGHGRFRRGDRDRRRDRADIWTVLRRAVDKDCPPDS
jgi:excinuclease UvrABC nuclease subunit